MLSELPLDMNFNRTPNIFKFHSAVYMVFIVYALFASSVVQARPVCASLFYDQYLPGGIRIGILNRGGRILIETPRLLLSMKEGGATAVVTLRTTLQEVGTINFFRRSEGELHLPLISGSKFHGYGYATEYKYALIKYGFATTNADRIFAQVYNNNSASLKLHSKLSFQEDPGTRQKEITFFGLTRAAFQKLEDSILDPEAFVLPKTKLERRTVTILLDFDQGTKTYIRRLKSALQILSGSKRLTGGAADQIHQLAKSIQANSRATNLPPRVLAYFVRLFSYYEGNSASNFSLHYNLVMHKDILDDRFELPQHGPVYRNVAKVLADMIFDEAEQRGALDGRSQLRLEP